MRTPLVLLIAIALVATPAVLTLTAPVAAACPQVWDPKVQRVVDKVCETLDAVECVLILGPAHLKDCLA